MTELRRLRGASETLLKGLSVQRRLEEDSTKNIQSQPIDLALSNIEDHTIFGAQEVEAENGNDNKEKFIYLAIIAMVAAILLFTCVVITLIIRSTLRKELQVKSISPPDATDNLPQDSASSVMDSAASRSTATGGKSAYKIPLPVSLMGSGKAHRMPKDLSVVALRDTAALPRTPLEILTEVNATKEKDVRPVEIEDSPPPRQYSPSMRLLLEQVETLSCKPGQVPPIQSEQNGTSDQQVENVNLTEL